MTSLSDAMLVDSYEMAIDLQLDDEFIMLLLAEICRRKLHIEPMSN